MMLKLVFAKRWVLTTALVIAAAVVMVRLGFWQLDRLAQRRAFNSRVVEQLDAPPLILDQEALGLDLAVMDFRAVTVQGQYDPSNQVTLRNQVHFSRIGVHLLTPLKIAGTGQLILVDRGWIPAEDNTPEGWRQYDQLGKVLITGVIRRTQTEQSLGKQPDPTLTPGQTGLDTWNMVNLARIEGQIPGILTTVYVQQTPGEEDTGLPAPQAVDLELDEGPHLGYAFQWYLFAATLLAGYPFYVRSQEQRAQE